MKLFDYQLDAINRMSNGCVLCGGVGSGKSLTAVAYYYIQCGGSMDFLKGGEYEPMVCRDPLYIITTARKRDTREWDNELKEFLLADASVRTVDSWNNIAKYAKVENAFCIFDEQRVVGHGAWVRSFLKIVKNNQWILLSATPGDTWSDYIPLFVANGFFKNRTEFCNEHVIYSAYTNYPKIERYVGEKRLRTFRDKILVDMDFHRQTVAHHENVWADYDLLKYRTILRNRYDPWEEAPIENPSDLCYCLRKCVNGDESRQRIVLELVEKHPKAIIFYSFDYELDILRSLSWPEGTVVKEWNGHKHELIPDSDKWVYLVNYGAGSEGWNCTQTDTIIFYSQHYSYKVLVQASGRIDRLNTPFHDLYYYHLKSSANIDLGIAKAIRDKKTFNENRFIKW